MDVSELLPRDSGLVVRDLIECPGYVRIEAETGGCSADCPRCEVRSDRVHGRYVRAVADLPWQGRQVRIRIHVRRFRCGNPRCPQRTFAERVPSVADHAQSTRRLAEAQLSIGFALVGEPGSRLSRRLAMPTSPDTLLRRVRAAGSDHRPTPRVLGVDDFAFRKASTFGTILVDLERRCAVDLLPDREAATLRAGSASIPASRSSAATGPRPTPGRRTRPHPMRSRWPIAGTCWRTCGMSSNDPSTVARSSSAVSCAIRHLRMCPCRRRRPKGQCRKPARWHRSSGSRGSSASDACTPTGCRCAASPGPST